VPDLRVDFYITAAGNARLGLACKLAEKAYLAAHNVLIWNTDRAELQELDELLWTFRDGSFVPHELLDAHAREPETPVVLSCGPVPAGDLDVIINLAAGVPDFIARARRVVEIIDGDESRRQAGRARYKAYLERGVQPASHNL
jgi:DNA polymerase III subunit chi